MIQINKQSFCSMTEMFEDVNGITFSTNSLGEMMVVSDSYTTTFLGSGLVHILAKAEIMGTLVPLESTLPLEAYIAMAKNARKNNLGGV